MERVLIVGAGPSLKENLADLKRLGDFPGIVIATDAALQHMYNAGIFPQECACLEDLHQLTKYFTPDIVKENGETLERCWISDRVHARVRQAMTKANINFEVAAKVRELSTSNVGLFATAIGHLIHGVKEIHFVGMDHCYAKENPPPVPREDPLFDLGFYVVLNPHDDEELILNPAHELWREELHENLKLWSTLNIVNHTGRGAIFGKQIKWQPLKNVKQWPESFL
jgi:hypothetical protein